MTIIAFFLVLYSLYCSVEAWQVTLDAMEFIAKHGMDYGILSVAIIGCPILLVGTHTFLVLSVAFVLDGNGHKKADWVVETLTTPISSLFSFSRPTRTAGA